MTATAGTAGTAETRTDGLRWDGVVTLHGRVENRLAKALQRHHGIGLSEYRTLCRLVHADDGELRMQELADLIGLNQSSVSRLVTRLENAGLTRRDHCPADRRGVYTQVTDEGRALQEKAAPTYHAELTGALDEAAADPALAPLVQRLRGL
ncbi:MarR family winged helix-turn-helix transcriptional regulator [Actinomadura sp. WMMB 499]|uniref:MarR family winged helix-turn-helix transcriptional regulator n=1 Tax=Actinomadura sp. WMMB 499 TaxID=1219491 RepID=UPI0012445882|nr:MarR family transcriptional regulator [Actinomadura sp. WMMB 499]QFG23046.1 MarR family transcriptional regulator [Actinomadura sp. WMMB 499]